MDVILEIYHPWQTLVLCKLLSALQILLRSIRLLFWHCFHSGHIFHYKQKRYFKKMWSRKPFLEILTFHKISFPYLRDKAKFTETNYFHKTNPLVNKNAFQWDAYRPLVDPIPACTGQGGCLRRGVADTPRTKGRHPPWTDRHLWKHNLRKLRLRPVKIDKHLLFCYPGLFFRVVSFPEMIQSAILRAQSLNAKKCILIVLPTCILLKKDHQF